MPRFISVSAPDPVRVSAAALVGEHKRLRHTRRTTTTHGLIYAGLDHSRSVRLIAGFDDYVCSNFDLILIHENLVLLLPGTVGKRCFHPSGPINLSAYQWQRQM